MGRDRDHLVLEHEVGGVADDLLGHADLVVVDGVHEHEVVAVAVEVLEVAPVDGREVDLGAGVEGAVDDLAAQHVLHLGAHERAALAGLHVLELDDVPELSVDVQNAAVLDVVRGGHSDPA